MLGLHPISHIFDPAYIFDLNLSAISSKTYFFHLMMLKCFFSCWFIPSRIIGNSWGVFSNLAFVILNPQPTWPFQYVRDWCGGDREFSKLVALKLSALSPCTPLLMLKYIQNISKYVKTSSPDKYWSRNMYTWDFYFPILYRFYKNANTHKTYPDQEFPLAVLGKPYFYTSSSTSSITPVWMLGIEKETLYCH